MHLQRELYVGLPLDVNARVGELRDLKREISALEKLPSTTSDRQARLDAAHAKFSQKQQELGSDRRLSIHLLLGVAATLTIVFVDSVVITYFIGTSRWCREVTEAYALDPTLLCKSQRLKRRSFPWALLGSLTALAISALGAAADPGTFAAHTAYWVTPHFCAALIGLGLVAWSFWMLWMNITANQEVISQIMAHVRQVRMDRGLVVQ